MSLDPAPALVRLPSAAVPSRPRAERALPLRHTRGAPRGSPSSSPRECSASLTGEVNLGKTSAVRAAVAALERSRHTVIYVANPAIGARLTTHRRGPGRTPALPPGGADPSELLQRERSARGRTPDGMGAQGLRQRHDFAIGYAQAPRGDAFNVLGTLLRGRELVVTSQRSTSHYLRRAATRLEDARAAAMKLGSFLAAASGPRVPYTVRTSWCSSAPEPANPVDAGAGGAVLRSALRL